MPSQGTSTGGIEKSPAYRKGELRARQAEQQEWAEKCGPVTVRFVCPVCGGPHPKSSCIPSTDFDTTSAGCKRKVG